MKKIEIYVDGACQGNPGPGGWGVLLRCNGVEKELSGFDPGTTNNRMELMAAIQGLEAVTKRSHIAIYTDSTYVRDGISKWIHGWIAKNWRTANGHAVKNKDLWERLHALNAGHDVEWHWVKGHAGHPENERVDALARQAIIERIGEK